MRVEQAIYGEVAGRGHGLRASSTNAPIFANITSKLDLPDAVPPNVKAWSPFVRGFPIHNHYVLARTFLDTSASRSGMVLTHALIIRLDDMCEIGSLAMLFRQLASSVEGCRKTLENLELEATSIDRATAKDLIGTANALAIQEQIPAVRLGIDGFEHLVDSLWNNLWPALRRTFAFRLSFDPKDLVEQPKPMLVCTPEQLQARWSRYCIVKPDEQTPNSENAKILCGQRDVRPILSLAKELGVEVHTLRELSRLEWLHKILSVGTSFDDLLAAVRMINGLSKQSTFGTEIKDRLLSQFTQLVSHANCKQLLLMKNLSLSGFADSQSLWSAVERSVSILRMLPADDNDLIEIILASADEKIVVPEWRTTVTSGLSRAAYRDSPDIFQAIWRWAERSDAAFHAAVGALSIDSDIEQRLSIEVPRKLNNTFLATLLHTLLNRHWLIAHGAVLAATQSPLDATGQQLQVDKNLNQITGLRSALRYASPIQTLECALAHKDTRLIELCAEQAISHPEILANIRCEDMTEQQIWCATMNQNLSLWNAPNNPFGVRDTVLTRFTNGNSFDKGLLQTLARTPLADLSSMEGREQLWSLLPTMERDQYMQATVIGWLEVAARGKVRTIPEPPLERAILADSHLQRVLDKASVTFEACLAIVSVLSSFPEDRFISLLSNRLSSTSVIYRSDSEQLGVIIKSRHWKRTAKHIAERFYKRHPDLTHGLKLCADLLGFYLCWKLNLSRPSADEKWKSFEEEVLELYPHGPDSSELWSRAGGKNSDLLGSSQNGITRWHNALRSIRYGGRPTATMLLNVMLVDFPKNEKLCLFIRDSDIVGRH